VAEPLGVFVVHHLTEEFSSAGLQASDGGVDVID
jgi:hypothetical protein